MFQQCLFYVDVFMSLEFARENSTVSSASSLQIHLLETLLPDAKPEIRMCRHLWSKGGKKSFVLYYRFVACCKVALGGRRLWLPSPTQKAAVLLLRRGHAWVQDQGLTKERWCRRNFMFHGWKANKVNESEWKSPFLVREG